jgi:hypothetical protein
LPIAELLNCAIHWANADWGIADWDWWIGGLDHWGIDAPGRIDSLECRPNDAIVLNAEMPQSAMIQ